MKLNSSTPLALELKDKEIRKHTVESQIRIGVPFQLRAIREHQRMTQAELAEKIGTTQNTISRLENPKTSKPTIKTLLRLAEAFDIGLLVRFVPFGFYGGVIESMDESHIEVPSYGEELNNELSIAAHAGSGAINPYSRSDPTQVDPSLYPDGPSLWWSVISRRNDDPQVVDIQLYRQKPTFIERQEEFYG